MKSIHVILSLLFTIPCESKAENGILFSEAGVYSAIMEQEPLPLELQAAMDQLIRAEALESPYIGFAASPSENLKQLRILISGENGEQMMLLLYDKGNITAKLYAIIGLQLLEETDLAQSLIKDAYQFQFENVTTVEGCIIFQQNVQDLLKITSEGYYSEMFRESY